MTLGAGRIWSLRFRLREWLDSSWLVIPGVYVFGALVLGRLVPWLERRMDSPPAGLVLSDAAALDILQAVTSGMIAFTGLVVSVAVVVVQFGAGQYTPRLVLRFRRDPAVKHSLGIFVAPALFAAVSLADVGKHGDGQAGSGLSVLVALVLLVSAIFAFFLLVARLLDLIRPRRLFEQLRVACDHAIDQVYPQPLSDHDDLAPPTLGPVTGTVMHHGPNGVVTAIDAGGLVRAAVAADVVFEVPVRIGEYVRGGQPLLLVYGELPAAATARLRSSVLLAEERTLTQDPSFAVRTIVDIAIRALSPAVNDPTTAAQGLDALESIVLRLAERDLGSGHLPGPVGETRVVYPAASWPELLDLALTEIRAFGAGSHQIARRLRALLLTLRDEAPASRVAAVEAQLALLDAAVIRAFPDEAERAVAMVPDHAGLGGRRHRAASGR